MLKIHMAQISSKDFKIIDPRKNTSQLRCKENDACMYLYEHNTTHTTDNKQTKRVFMR